MVWEPARAGERKAGSGRPGPLPGLALCPGIALLGRALQALEEAALGHVYLDGLVAAILLGTAVRTAWEPGETWRPGIRLGAGRLLEVAVVLLGASLDLRAALAAGPGLVLGIAGAVALAVAAGYGVGRAAGLPRRMALLVACGNAICGNSAIAAVAPVIGATGREVASAIAFTAVLGVAVVLALPLLVPALGLSATQYGVLAGLTVYAVPQVLAATAPLGSLSMQAGTLVKLLRVLMLGPLVLLLSLAADRTARRGAGAGGAGAALRGRPGGLGRFVPWFVAGFLLLAVLSSLGLVPPAALRPLRLAAGVLTAVAMAALGLGVELRALGRAGARVGAAAAVSLLVLVGLGLGLIRLLRIA
jgi:uncharacterized integral membrane protein (TIGR00698 family)